MHAHTRPRHSAAPCHARPPARSDKVLKTIEQASDLAPLHNPPNLHGIDAARATYPDVPHVSCTLCTLCLKGPPSRLLRLRDRGDVGLGRAHSEAGHTDGPGPSFGLAPRLTSLQSRRVPPTTLPRPMPKAPGLWPGRALTYLPSHSYRAEQRCVLPRWPHLALPRWLCLTPPSTPPWPRTPTPTPCPPTSASATASAGRALST